MSLYGMHHTGCAHYSLYSSVVLHLTLQVNLRHGLPTPSKGGWDTTCTACAGTLLLEFAALSRLTGNPVYEEKAHQAMEVLWSKRNASHDLVGTVINVNTGEWVRKGESA